MKTKEQEADSIGKIKSIERMKEKDRSGYQHKQKNGMKTGFKMYCSGGDGRGGKGLLYSIVSP